MTRQLRTHVVLRAEGLVLIEVMMATVLLALLVVPLVSGVLSVTRSADAMRGKTAEQGDLMPGSEAGGAWEWGEVISQAWWRPGPTLHARAEYGSGADCTVGLWAEGWFLGEWKTSGNGFVEVTAPVWADLTGAELTARVRPVRS
jgi:hypothetical protein